MTCSRICTTIEHIIDGTIKQIIYKTIFAIPNTKYFRPNQLNIENPFYIFFFTITIFTVLSILTIYQFIYVYNNNNTNLYLFVYYLPTTRKYTNRNIIIHWHKYWRIARVLQQLAFLQ